MEIEIGSKWRRIESSTGGQVVDVYEPVFSRRAIFLIRVRYEHPFHGNLVINPWFSDAFLKSWIPEDTYGMWTWSVSNRRT